jgi:hypothetical protein
MASRKAKNSSLRQGTHKGKAPVSDARNALASYTVDPVSAATLLPGQGPPMSSTPLPAGRGSKSRAASRRGVASVQKIVALSGPARGISAKGGRGRASSSSRGRAGRKR